MDEREEGGERMMVNYKLFGNDSHTIRIISNSAVNPFRSQRPCVMVSSKTCIWPISSQTHVCKTEYVFQEVMKDSGSTHMTF